MAIQLSKPHPRTKQYEDLELEAASNHILRWPSCWSVQYYQESKLPQVAIQAQKEAVSSILKRRIRREYIQVV